MGSIPIGGIFVVSKGLRSWQGSNLRGQSPLDFKSNALTTRPQLLVWCMFGQKVWRCGGSNPGPFTCKANALPLSYIPCVGDVEMICPNIEKDPEQPTKRRVPTGGLEPPIFGLGDRRLIH